MTLVLVKRYAAEQGTPEALSLTSRHAVLASALAPIEVTSALRRQEATGGLTRRQRDRALCASGRIAPTGLCWNWTPMR